MRRRAAELAALVVLIAGVAGASAQTSGGSSSSGSSSGTSTKAKSKLEEALVEALRNNPDLRVALAKVNEAEAELHRTRLQVAQKVVNAYRAIELAKSQLAEAERRERARLGPGELAAAQAKLAAAEADLDY